MQQTMNTATLVPSQFDPPSFRSFRPLNSHKGKFRIVISAEGYPRQYQVENLSPAGKIDGANDKIPGLIPVQAQYGLSKPSNGSNITCAPHNSPQTAAIVESLIASGLDVRLCSNNSISSTEDHVAAAIARASAPVLPWRGRTVEETLSCMSRALDWGPSGGGPDLIFDSGGDLTRLIHEGVIAEKEFARTGAFLDPKSIVDLYDKAMLTVLSESLKSDPMKYHKIKDRLVGATINNSRTASILLQMQMDQTLLFPVINVSESVSKFANYSTGGFQSLPDDLMDATRVQIVGKVAVVALLELWKERSSGKYEKKVYEVPKQLAEVATALHHENLREDQADHISLHVEGDHQPANNFQVEGDNQPANVRDRAGQCLKVLGVVGLCLGAIAAGAELIVLVYGLVSN